MLVLCQRSRRDLKLGSGLPESGWLLLSLAPLRGGELLTVTGGLAGAGADHGAEAASVDGVCAGAGAASSVAGAGLPESGAGCVGSAGNDVAVGGSGALGAAVLEPCDPVSGGGAEARCCSGAAGRLLAPAVLPAADMASSETAGGAGLAPPTAACAAAAARRCHCGVLPTGVGSVEQAAVISAVDAVVARLSQAWPAGMMPAKGATAAAGRMTGPCRPPIQSMLRVLILSLGWMSCGGWPAKA
jgi:hypothetical protein